MWTNGKFAHGKWSSGKWADASTEKEAQRQLNQKKDEKAILERQGADTKDIEAADKAVKKAQHDLKTTTDVTREKHIFGSSLVHR
jgi:hypothetical protein